MDSETPFAGDGPDDGDDAPYKWLDEWLCEYVDGTMDPSLEAIFEQYVEANPELKAHVQRLKKTRELLCERSFPPPSSEAEPPPALSEDLVPSSPSASSSSPKLRDRPLVVLGMVSSVTAALVIGFVLGATTVPPTLSSASSATAVERPRTSRSSSSPESEGTRESIPLFLQQRPESSSDSARASTFTRIDLP